MISMPLIFYISPQWKQKNNNLSIDKHRKMSSKHLRKSKSLDIWHNQSAVNHKNNTDSISLAERYMTINLNKNDQNIRTARNFNEILNDIQTYRNELYDTHGSIHIQIYSFQSTRCCCCCDQKQSNEICKQISTYENELFQNDFVEYIYHISSINILRNRILFNP
jgi:hypothetical protein